ncbi:hypothetical protein [Photorhabdus aegyptia]|uniref:Uncharacterized protein n=1 Tax=Photorhabdus aegyptia TaxID=2805098 RepID=A0A022PS93_9GAMM|nr:hypothetical protein [Photorhabdus aegyptia]EYU17165.1 hypothetical protein BA1DRAFT_00224 [Photorhabdus aegyptia]MBS9423866.1 hypothetical protein [Photorhabdus caribbeanensis]
MNKNYAVSPQIINIAEISSEPWGIQNSSSYFIYDNSATKEFIRKFKQPFGYGKIYNHALP